MLNTKHAPKALTLVHAYRVKQDSMSLLLNWTLTHNILVLPNTTQNSKVGQQYMGKLIKFNFMLLYSWGKQAATFYGHFNWKHRVFYSQFSPNCHSPSSEDICMKLNFSQFSVSPVGYLLSVDSSKELTDYWSHNRMPFIVKWTMLALPTVIQKLPRAGHKLKCPLTHRGNNSCFFCRANAQSCFQLHSKIK